MAQFQLYTNKDKRSSAVYPYFIDVQNDLLNGLNTRMVIPLTPLTQLDNLAPSRLCPSIHLPAGDFVILTQQMTSVPSKVLSEPIADLSIFRNDIIANVDLMTSVRSNFMSLNLIGSGGSSVELTGTLCCFIAQHQA